MAGSADVAGTTGRPPGTTGLPPDAAASSRRGAVRHWATIAVLAAALVWMVAHEAGFEALLRLLVPGKETVIYPTVPLPVLMADQLKLVAMASSIALLLGGSLGVLALTPPGRPFRDVLVSLGNIAQTVPTPAILALVVPLTGYGAEPVVIALVAYSVLPIMLNVIAGIESVPHDQVDAATGVGMTAVQRFWQVQVPQAMPVLRGGVKNMLVINVSAATIGAIAAAGGLGQPILAGFSRYNTAFIIEGALPAAVLALLVDRLLTPVGDTGA